MLPFRLSLLTRRAFCSSLRAQPNGLKLKYGQRSISTTGGTRSYALTSPGAPCRKPSAIYQAIGKRAFSSQKNQASSAVKKEATGKAAEANSVVGQPTRNATDMAIIKQLMRYVWPKDDNGVKARVVIALGLLVGGKVCTLFCVCESSTCSSSCSHYPISYSMFKFHFSSKMSLIL
jgi:hypothetical protein